LLKPRVHERSHQDPERGKTNRRFVGTNPPAGASIYYHIGEKAKETKLQIFDAAGDPVRTLPTVGEPGLHRVVWDLNRVTPRTERREQPASGDGAPPSGEGTGGGETTAQAAIMNARPRQAPAGTYKVVLTVDGKDYVQALTLEADPRLPEGAIASEAEEAEEQEAPDEEELEREGIGEIID
jgi:hypothetical protein